jgi:hypothetical protein
VEEYAVRETAASDAVAELAAMTDAMAPGLGALVAGLARMVGGLTGADAGAMPFDAVERRVTVEGRELLRMTVQHVMDVRAAAEVRLADVADAPGVPRPRAERGRARTVVSSFGPVRVSRIAYRAPGQQDLHPADAVLGLPPRRQSWQVQRTVTDYALAGSYEQAQRFLLEATGQTAGKLQIEQIVADAAADAAGFYDPPGEGDCGPGQAPAPGGDDAAADAGGAGADPLAGVPLGLSADGKGVLMRPEARRPVRGKRGQKARKLGKRASTGEKPGTKRMAETGVVFDAVPVPGPPRTPEDVMLRPPGQPARGPKAVNKWYTVDITATRKHTIGAIFDEAGRRDPGHARTWVALVDGDIHQIEVTGEEAAARGVHVTVLIDFIHVLEYLWKAAWCFHPPADPAAEAWVTARALDILHGNAPAVITEIGRLAAQDPPRPGSEHDKNIARTVSYLSAKAPYLDYPAALAKGWPIATGVIEGACRHLVNDRMGITGARWGLQGAEAILRLRAIRANGDLDAYWDHHISKEHHRNHTSRYQQGQQLAALPGSPQKSRTHVASTT